MEKEKIELEHSIDEKKEMYNTLLESKTSLEKYAREKYGMKSENEVVFTIDESEL